MISSIPHLVSASSFGANPTFSWNLFSDFSQMWSFEFFQHAFETAAVVSVVAGVIGYFVVLRKSAFAGHALSHIGFAGGAGAVALSVNPIWGLLTFCLGAAVVMGGLGQRLGSRDAVIGIVMAFSLGLGAVFLSLYTGDASEAVSLLFGEILGISTLNVVVTLVIGALALAAMALLYRPLLFSSIDEDVAVARGVPVRLVSIGFMVTVALSVAVAVQVVGVLLIFALLVTPAAIAQRFTRRPLSAICVSVAVALVASWLGLFLSWYFPYPVSFFITSLVFFAYVVVRVAPRLSPLVQVGNKRE